MNPKLKVIGVGSAAGVVIDKLIKSKLTGADFVAVNTDSNLLGRCAAKRVLIGRNLTGGLGAGGKPDIGRRAAKQAHGRIERALRGATTAIIVACMGGGTGSGATAPVAEICRRLGISTIAVVTRPFTFEGETRNKNAERGIQRLMKHSDAVTVIPCDRILDRVPGKLLINDAFAGVDAMLHEAIHDTLVRLR